MSDVRPEFQSHELNDHGKKKVGRIAEIFSQALTALTTEELDVSGRELSLVITNMQQAKMWACASASATLRNRVTVVEG